MRRAEKSGESKKQLEDVTASFVAIGEEKKALAVANDKLTADLRATQDELRSLRQSREMDQKSFRDAAEMTVKWKMEEVEKQLEHLRSELKIKRDECADTVQQLHTVQQQLASEQTLSRSTSGKLQEALSELKRMRESNVKFDASAKEYKEHCATLERELAASGQRSAALSQTVEECKRMLEEASASHAEKLRNNDAAWEGRMRKLQVEMQEAATQHETVMEDHHVKYALLQSEMEEARELMGEARTKILTLEDEKKAAIDQAEKLALELAEATSRVAELDTKCNRVQSELEKVQQLNGETIEEMKASFLDEEESLQAELRDAKDKAEKLSDATQKLKDKVRVCVYHTVPLCLCMPL
jgi:DNA repair exonuclease SbcCD ATPase subunit